MAKTDKYFIEDIIMGRMYTALMDATSISAADDLMRISAPSDAVVKIHEVLLTQDASETSEMLPVQLQRSSTDGTGTSTTPEKLEGSDAAFGGTVVRALTADTTISGVPISRMAQNVLNGWHWLFTPEMRPVVAPSGRFVVRLDTAPTAALTLTLVVTFEEIG
jgi:hypothetical protein